VTPDAGPGYKVHAIRSKTDQRVLEAKASGFLVAIASEHKPDVLRESFWAVSFQGMATDPAGVPVGRVFKVCTEDDARNAMGLLAGLHARAAHGN
jgi:hypothetical protein